MASNGGYYSEQPYYANQPNANQPSPGQQANYAQPQPGPQDAPYVGGHEELDTIKNPSFHCNDWGCAAAFVIGLIATLVTGAIYINKWRDYINLNYRYDMDYTLGLDSKLAYTPLIASAIGLVLGVVVLGLVRLCNGYAVTISIICSIVIYLAMIGISAALQWWGIMVFCIIMALFFMIYYCCVRRRIPFAEAVVLGSVKSIFTFWGVIPSVILSAAVTAGYAIFWIHTINAVIYVIVIEQRLEAVNEINMTPIYIAYVFLAFAYYWSTETFRNVAHTTTAGAVGTWWYCGNETKAVTFGAFRRAVTSSFGSIACGSLLVALIETMKLLVRMFLGRNSLLGCLLHCVLSCVERILRYFNSYAYTYVALYGKDYLAAGRSVTELFERSAFTAIINDDLTWCVVSFNSFLVGIIGALICAFSFDKSIPDDNRIYFYIIAIFGFIFAYAMCQTVLSVLLSAVKTTFVVWAEDPAAMQAAQPEAYNHIANARSIYYKE